MEPTNFYGSQLAGTVAYTYALGLALANISVHKVFSCKIMIHNRVNLPIHEFG